MRRCEVVGLVRQALNELYARDHYLLRNDGSEWSIAHRLAVYLERRFPEWNVDCEYNRQGVSNLKKSDGKTVRPDIVIHHRGFSAIEHNLLVIELKKSSAEKDVKKLKDYTSRPKDERKFQYQFGLMIELADPMHLSWFKDGEPLLDQEGAATCSEFRYCPLTCAWPE